MDWYQLREWEATRRCEYDVHERSDERTKVIASYQTFDPATVFLATSLLDQYASTCHTDDYESMGKAALAIVNPTVSLDTKDSAVATQMLQATSESLLLPVDFLRILLLEESRDLLATATWIAQHAIWDARVLQRSCAEIALASARLAGFTGEKLPEYALEFPTLKDTMHRLENAIVETRIIILS